MEKIINLLINNWTKGVDTYTHNGSTWLIFSESKQWVIELTESKTLWYNYNFFKELFSLTSMDVVDNQHYITKWVEDNIINKVKDTILEKNITEGEVEEIIENGFKGIKNRGKFTFIHLDDIIQNGVKETNHVDVMKFFDNKMDDALENGIKETHDDAHNHKDRIDGVIKNGVMETFDFMGQNISEDEIDGVKETELHKGNRRFATNYAIKRGVKETHREIREYKNTIDYIIQTGVKETKACYYKDPKTNLMFIKWDYQINNIIETGIKEVQPLPSQEGNKDWGNYYHAKKNRVKPFIEYLDEAIMFGVKETRADASQNPMGKVNQVIENGIKKPTD
jgi:hypothetical protein